MRRAKGGLALLAAIGAAAAFSGCAADRLEHPSYWWNAKVLAIEPVSALAPEVNRDCLTAAPGGAPVAPDRVAVVVSYRLAKSSMTKAYLDTRGEDWVVGEKAYVHPDSCRIKHAF